MAPTKPGAFRYDTNGNLDRNGAIVYAIDSKRFSVCVSDMDTQISARYESPTEADDNVAFFRRPGCVDQIGVLYMKGDQGSLSNNSALLRAIVAGLAKRGTM